MNCEKIGHSNRPPATWAPPPCVKAHVNFMAESRLLKRAPQTWHFSLLCFDFSCAPRQLQRVAFKTQNQPGCVFQVEHSHHTASERDPPASLLQSGYEQVVQTEPAPRRC